MNIETIKRLCPEFAELLEINKKANFAPWKVDSDFKGNNWLICSTGQTCEGLNCHVTTDGQRGSETNHNADALTDAEMIVAARNAVIPMIKALAQAREALGKHGKHQCKKADFDYKECTCGLVLLLPQPAKEGG